ncbi:sodium:solute symporter family protein [Desulfotomaculum copahuensis]|uniref:Sodium:solute symporter n=1 Tax=Desulfotomaculum copahuensis TaxID=1838280 RepID=A0A1B7LGN6_9FIRM|nr:sodium:solute symporter family protein [Desulfotomaculum copahuensis]OAT85267.1 sodium:solute symporter [Desulfotomaculum copahuensis]
MNLAVLAVILVIYVAIISYLTYLGSRQTRSAEDYTVAGRQMSGWIMALSYASTFISTSAIVGFGGAAGMFGFTLLWLSFFNIFLGIFVAFIFLGEPIRRMTKNLGATTLATMLGERYQSKFITWFIGLMIFLLMPPYTGVVLIGGARFIEESLHISFQVALVVLAVIIALYVGWGGLKGVMYADAFMCGMMLLGMVILLFKTYAVVGGVVAGHQALTNMASLVPEALKKGGDLGWTAMPQWGSPIWWTVISTIVMGVGIGVLAQPQLILRFLTVPTKQALNRAVLTGGICIFFFTGTAFMVGPLTNVYFHDTVGKIAIAAAKGNVDLIIPSYINAVMPPAYIYLFMVTLLSACITTVNGLIHVQSVAFSRDLLATWNIKANPLTLSRIGVLVGAVAAVVMAFILPVSIIARATAFWFGICAAGILPALLGAIFWRRVTKAAAVWSVALGYGVSIFGFVFLHASEAVPFGICKAIFGRPTLLPDPWTFVDPLFYSIVISAAALIFITLFTKPLPREHVNRCFAGLGKTQEVTPEKVVA